MSPLARLMWSGPFYLVFLLLALLPFIGNSLPVLDGAFAPVTSRITPLNPTVLKDGSIAFRYEYRKFRACEILGIDARDTSGRYIELNAVDGSFPTTRSTGEHVSKVHILAPSSAGVLEESTGPYLVGASIYFIHRCNPFWLTQTQVYP